MTVQIVMSYKQLNHQELMTVTGGNLSDNLKQLRQEHHLTQDMLARRLFVTRQAVSQWEKGLREPSIATIIRLHDLLEVSFERILK